MTETVQRVVADLRARLQRVYGDRLIELRLFGSRARGEAGPDSDYDVLVVLRGPTDPETELFRASPEIAEVCLEHDAVLSCFFRGQDVLTFSGEPFLENALREGVLI